MDVNSKEAELWSETMKLKSENAHLRDILAVALSHLEGRPEYASRDVVLAYLRAAKNG